MSYCKIIPFVSNGGFHEMLTDVFESTVTVNCCIVPGSN